MEIKISSPTRVDLGGGTLDCWPLYSIIGRCYTINLAIDIMTHVHLVEKNTSEIELEMTSLDYKKKFSDLDELMASSDKELALIKGHLNFWKPNKGFFLSVSSESPVGGGLGGSSSLTISLLKAFGQWLGADWNLQKVVTVAANIETQLLNAPAGTQDYIPAFQPGLNCISYNERGFDSQLIDFDPSFVNERLSLIYTGKAHHSGINNWQVIKSVVEHDEKTITALKDIATIADDLKVILENKSYDQLGELFKREYQARVQLSPGFTSPEIEALNDICLGAGADAVKICGAGGGGCVMVWGAPETKKGMIEKCQEKGFQVLNAKAVVS